MQENDVTPQMALDQEMPVPTMPAPQTQEMALAPSPTPKFEEAEVISEAPQDTTTNPVDSEEPKQIELTPEQIEIYKIRLAEETYHMVSKIFLKTEEEGQTVYQALNPTKKELSNLDEENQESGDPYGYKESVDSAVIRYTLLIDNINEALKEAFDQDGIDDIKLEGKLNFWWVLNNHRGIIELIRKIVTIIRLFKEHNNIQ